MKIGPITVWQRMRGNGVPSQRLLLVSLHWKWSLTWRFHLSWAPWSACQAGVHFMRTYRGMSGINFSFVANIPLVGSISLQTQPNIRRKK